MHQQCELTSYFGILLLGGIGTNMFVLIIFKVTLFINMSLLVQNHYNDMEPGEGKD